MSIVAVDLAAKYSAACHMRMNGTVSAEVDSWGISESDFIGHITAPWRPATSGSQPRVLAVEDLPQRVPWMTTTKAVARLQGRIIERMDSFQALPALLFVPPQVWRALYPELRVRGSGPAAVAPVATALDYTPPALEHRIIGKGDRAIARKVATDYAAAFLIARWALYHFDIHGHFDAPATTRYTETNAKV